MMLKRGDDAVVRVTVSHKYIVQSISDFLMRVLTNGLSDDNHDFNRTFSRVPHWPRSTNPTKGDAQATAHVP